MEEVFKGIGFLLLIAAGIILAMAALALLGSIGVLFGSGMSVRNYCKSLKENVSFEKPVI